MPIMTFCKTTNLSLFIGPIGTLLGTILGWLLHYITNNIGKTNISVDEYVLFKDSTNDFAYNIKLFLCNNSLKPKYIKNLKIKFYNKRKFILESQPKYNKNINFRNLKSKNKIPFILLKYYQPQYIVLCDLIQNTNYDKLSSATKAILYYSNYKNRTKKKVLIKHFSIDKVSSYQYQIFPQQK